MKRLAILLPTDVPDRAGGVIHEEVLVEDLGDGRRRVLKTPGAVMGMAAGDVFVEVRDTQTGFKVLERAGNIGVQIYCDNDLDTQEDFLSKKFKKLKGRLDGCTVNTLVYTIPLTSNISQTDSAFEAIEAIMDEFGKCYPRDTWQYANVYDDDGNPLNWWDADAAVPS